MLDDEFAKKMEMLREGDTRVIGQDFTDRGDGGGCENADCELCQGCTSLCRRSLRGGRGGACHSAVGLLVK